MSKQGVLKGFSKDFWNDKTSKTYRMSQIINNGKSYAVDQLEDGKPIELSVKIAPVSGYSDNYQYDAKSGSISASFLASVRAFDIKYQDHLHVVNEIVNDLKVAGYPVAVGNGAINIAPRAA